MTCSAVHVVVNNHTTGVDEIVERVCNCNALYFNNDFIFLIIDLLTFLNTNLNINLFQ